MSKAVINGTTVGIVTLAATKNKIKTTRLLHMQAAAKGHALLLLRRGATAATASASIPVLQRLRGATSTSMTWPICRTIDNLS